MAPSQGYRKPHLGLSRGPKSRNRSRASVSHRWDRDCRPPAPGSRRMVLDISFSIYAFGSLPCSLQNSQVGTPTLSDGAILQIESLYTPNQTLLLLLHVSALISLLQNKFPKFITRQRTPKEQNTYRCGPPCSPPGLASFSK